MRALPAFFTRSKRATKQPRRFATLGNAQRFDRRAGGCGHCPPLFVNDRDRAKLVSAAEREDGCVLILFLGQGDPTEGIFDIVMNEPRTGDVERKRPELVIKIQGGTAVKRRHVLKIDLTGAEGILHVIGMERLAVNIDRGVPERSSRVISPRGNRGLCMLPTKRREQNVKARRKEHRDQDQCPVIKDIGRYRTDEHREIALK